MGLASKLAAASGGVNYGSGQRPPPPVGATGNIPFPSPYGSNSQQPTSQYPPQQGSYGQPPSQYNHPSIPPGGYGQQQSQYNRPPASVPGGQGGYPQQGYGQSTNQGYGQPTRPAGGSTTSGYGQTPSSYGQAPSSYGQQQPPSGGTLTGESGAYFSVLQQAVRENHLEPFYPTDRLRQIASTVSNQAHVVSQHWQIPLEIASDIVRLALYDIVIFVDDSGSMAFEENGERIDDLKLILHRAAFAASLFDPNGIEIRFMNNNIQGNGIRSEEHVMDLVSNVKFHGLTPLGTSLRSKVLEPLVIQPARTGRLQKPVLVIAVTDGQPAGESASALTSAIREAKHSIQSTRYGPGALALQFGQVGNDLKAREFLSALDKDPVVGSMVDCTSNFEVEQDELSRQGVELTPATWVMKLLLGAIDKSYDTEDESSRSY